MLKSTLDCVDRYQLVTLAEEDRHKTVFITEDGRYKYQRVPQGYGASNDGYTIRTDEILARVPGGPENLIMRKLLTTSFSGWGTWGQPSTEYALSWHTAARPGWCSRLPSLSLPPRWWNMWGFGWAGTVFSLPLNIGFSNPSKHK